MRVLFSFVFLIYFSGFIKGGYCIDGSEIIKRVKQKYNTIESFSADFKQIFHWKLVGEAQENNGKIFLKNVDKFRIETNGQLIISDGTTLWTYSKINNQVIIDNMESSEEVMLPREIFLKFSKDYRPLLLGSERLTDADCYIVHLIANSENLFIKEMKVWIDKKNWLTLKIEHVDINENTTIYELSNILINKKIDKQKFTYKIPSNVEIIDMR